jgi:hypothetical protein
MYKKLLTVFIMLCSFLILSACGGGGSGSDSGNPAPPGSTITITPIDPTFTALSGDTFVDFTVSVKNKNGIPLNNVTVGISGGFAVPRVPARYEFHKSWNDDPITSRSFSAKTNGEGVYMFSIKIFATVNGVASEFEDFIQVQSGTVSASVTVTLGSTT